MSYFLDSDPVFLVHGAAGTSLNPKYDPVKRKEYYERSKQLKGRQPAAQQAVPQGSTSALSNHKMTMAADIASLQQALRVARVKGGKGKKEILKSIDELRKKNQQAIKEVERALKQGATHKESASSKNNKTANDNKDVSR